MRCGVSRENAALLEKTLILGATKMNNAEIREKLLDMRHRLDTEGSNLIEQAERVEKLYSQPTVRSRGYRTEVRVARERNRPLIDKIDKALADLEKRRPERALEIIESEGL